MSLSAIFSHGLEAQAAQNQAKTKKGLKSKRMVNIFSPGTDIVLTAYNLDGK